MKTLFLAGLLSMPLANDNICRARESRCELRCGDSTPGGSIQRLKCYDRCREDESWCRKEGP